MKLLQLYYFKALAEREHLTATAAELYISPPSLSAAISRLETDLGVPLFDRVGRNIRLNDKGRQFYDHVKLALDELDKGFDELQSTAAWNRKLSLSLRPRTSPLSPSPRVFPCENTSIFCAKRPDSSPKSWPRPTIPSGPGW